MQNKLKLVNLLPAVEQRELKLNSFAGKLSNFWFWVIGSLVIFFLLGLATRFYLDGMINDTQSEIDQDKLVLESSDYRELQNEITLLNRNIKEIKNLQNQHYYWSDALIELSNLVPDDMQVNQIIFDRTTEAIEITGQAQTRDSVIQFWVNVIKSEHFKNINFPLNNLEKATYPNFTYKFSVKPEKFKAP